MPSSYYAERTLEPEAPADLARIVAVLGRGSSDPTLRVRCSPTASTVYLTARPREDAGHGVAAILVQGGPRSSADATGPAPVLRALCPIRVTAWGHDAGEVEAFLASVPGLTGLRDDWEGFSESAEYRVVPERLRAAFRHRPGIRLAASGWTFKHLVSAVFEQRVTGAEAIGAWQTVVRTHGDPPPAMPEALARRGLRFPDGMRIFPTPAEWLAIPSWEWHAHGVDEHRARTVHRAAQAAASVTRADRTGGPADVARALAAIPGVGPWTIAETMQRSHGLPDTVSVGDYHLAHGVTHALEGIRGNDDRMLELLAPWRGNRQRVVRMILAAGPREQRRGPRVAPQGHRFY